MSILFIGFILSPLLIMTVLFLLGLKLGISRFGVVDGIFYAFTSVPLLIEGLGLINTLIIDGIFVDVLFSSAVYLWVVIRQYGRVELLKRISGLKSLRSKTKMRHLKTMEKQF